VRKLDPRKRRRQRKSQRHLRLKCLNNQPKDEHPRRIHKQREASRSTLAKKKTASISIQNVVASASIKQTLTLNSIVRTFPSVEHRPEQFPGSVYRLNKPKTATLLFSSGMMVYTGAHTGDRIRTWVEIIAPLFLSVEGWLILLNPVESPHFPKR